MNANVVTEVKEFFDFIVEIIVKIVDSVKSVISSIS